MEGRENNGRFAKGNQIAKDVQFQVDNHFASKYDPKFCDAIIDYFSKPISETVYDINGRAQTIVNDFPTIYGFAVSIGVVSRTLDHWREKYPEFSAAYDKARELQKDKLYSGSMSKKYDPSMAKFIASGFWGISEKIQNDTNMTVEVKMNKEFEEESQ